MGMLAELFSTGNRVKRRMRDLLQDPMAATEQGVEYLADQGGRPRTVADVVERAMNPTEADADAAMGFVGRTAFGRGFTAPTQAELAGRLHSLGIIGPRSTNQLYRMGANGRQVDPELLRLIEDEAIRKGRGFAL